MEKALSTNAGADACLGLYDKYYDTYLIDEPATTAEEKTYTVESGDSLWEIAKAQLKDGTQWEALYKLNQDVVKDPRLIYPGQILKLP